MAKTFAPTNGSRDNFNSLFERLSECESYLRLMHNELVHAEHDITFLTDRVATLEANYTALEAEDRAVLVALVDGGAKNLLDFEKWANAVGVVRGTKSVQGDAITITATGASCNTYWNSSDFPVGSRISVTPGEKVVLSWKTDNTSGNEKGQVYIFGNGSVPYMVYTSDISEILEYTIPQGVSYITWRVGVNAAGDSIKYSKLMLCSAADYAVSPKSVPYRPSWQEMWEMIQALQSGGASTQSVQPALMSAAAEREEEETDA